MVKLFVTFRVVLRFVIKKHVFMRKIAAPFFLSILLLLTGCGSSKQATSTTVIEGGDYDAAKNVTEYFVFPYGSVSLPGKWDKGKYDQSNRQQFFRNEESVIVAIAFAPSNKYEFNKDGSLKGHDFVEAFYKWESDYYKPAGFECTILENDSATPYLLFKIVGDDVNSVFLFGEKDGGVSNFSVQTTDKWTEAQKIQFLKTLFLTSAKDGK